MPWWVLLLAVATSAHVRLVFPPARQPALDYFSSVNSKTPCGIPKPPVGSGVRTFFQSGSTISIEWFTSIPHMGGIRLEVLNSLDQPIAIFNDFNDRYNITDTNKNIELPPLFECADCAIRLTHQATEYGSDYYFYSCADVNILKAIPDGDSCLSHGKRNDGKCLCNEGFTGDYCQYSTECNSNDECSINGECKITNDEPKGQCFCSSGRYGRNCEKNSDVIRSPSQFNESLYKMKQAEDNKIYWRIIGDEIEMVLRYPGQSWVAIGWKPMDAPCPSLIPEAEKSHTMTTSESKLKKLELRKPEVHEKQYSSTTERSNLEITDERTFNQNTSQHTNNVEKKNDTSSSAEDCAPNEIWTECPEMSRDCEASCDWTRFPETIPNCPRACGAARCVCKEGFVRITNDEDACVPFNFCDNETEPSCPTNTTWAKCGTACEPSCSNMYDTAPCPASCNKPTCTCADNYVRFEGKCIYWGDCPDLENHFHLNQTEINVKHSSVTEIIHAPSVSVDVPMVTRPTTISSRNLSCAVNETVNECGRVCEADCVSIFTRRECDDCGRADCACIQGYARNENGVCVYWGDCPIEGTGLYTRAPSLTTTTQILKKEPKQENPKVNGDVCYGEFRYPAGCKDCDYKLLWNYVDESDEIEFSLESKIQTNSWAGVGFSRDGSMVNADMLIIKSISGQLSLHDMTSEGYGAPVEDQQQDLKSPNVIGTHANGVLRAQFVRKRNTGEAVDKQFDTECWMMMFPVSGGKLDASGNITAHITTPLVSDKEVCIRSCREQKKSVVFPTCEHSYQYPFGCQDDQCEYTASWEYDSAKKDVYFEITSKNIGRWTGIGFSRDGQMTNSDIYTGWVYEGKAYLTDRFAYGRQLPAIDPADRQDIYDVGGKMEDEKQTIWFRRKVISNDRLTDYSLDKCYYFIFPIGGGRVLARKSSDFANPRSPIGYHDLYQPRVSNTKICICDENGTSIASEDSTARVRTKRQTDVPENALLDMISIKPKKPHAMECTDMVIASVIDGRARVRDFYSPSKATPRPDSFFGGSDSLTAASAFSENGITTVVFRRKLKGSEKWDHSFSPGPMTVIWAKGTDPNNYQHTTGGAPIKADPEFFAPGVFKYHGRNQRGSINIDFFEDSKKFETTLHGMRLDTSTCSGHFSFPEGCDKKKCTYAVQWMSDGNVARFSMQVMMMENQWTALGFSIDGSMVASDVIIIGLQKNHVITVTDQFMPSYGQPVVDEQQDIFDVETSFLNGVLTANFSRELSSDDKDDINLQQCIYLLYTPAGGRIERNGEITKHGETPKPSKTKICLNTCSEIDVKNTKMTTSIKEVTMRPLETTSGVRMPPLIKVVEPSIVYRPEKPVKVRYGLHVRILNRDFVPALADPQTQYYQSFTKDVASAINGLLAKRWKGMQVSKIFEYTKGSVVASFEVVSVNDIPRALEIQSLVEENAIRGHIGGLAIEPSTVKTNEIELTPAIVEEAMMNRDFVRNLVIIGVASIVLIFAVTCTCCLLCRVRRNTQRFETYPVTHPAAHPYGTLGISKRTPTGFDNAAFGHQRHYSQTTTASTRPGQSQNSPHIDANELAPGGMGETTYHEWYSKVGSKPASQHHEESLSPPRPPSAQPYVSYPNDPSGYYTLGGEHRTESRGTPKYFRPPY